MIEFNCPKCNGPLAAGDDLAGTMVACRHCSAWALVPGGGQAPVESEEHTTQAPCLFCREHIPLRLSDIGIPIRCPHCGGMLHVLPDPTTAMPSLRRYDEERAERPLSWRERARAISLEASWRTVKQILFHPVRFFRAMPLRGVGGLPFAVGVNVIGALLRFMLDVLCLFLFSHFLRTAPPWFTGPVGQSERLNSLVCTLPGCLVVIPALTMFRVAAGAVMSYAILRVSTERKPDFSATFEVIGYSEAGSFFRYLPVFGFSLAAVLSVVLAAIGFRETNKVGLGAAVTAAIVPPILLGLMCAGVVVWFGGDVSLVTGPLWWLEWK
ncbi:MAG: hypothetical protein AB1696_27675 [Planctomycetota bacterium]